MLQEQLKQMQGMMQQLQAKAEDKQTGHVVKLKVAEDKNKADMERTMFHETQQNKRALATHWATLSKHAIAPATTPKTTKSSTPSVKVG